MVTVAIPQAPRLRAQAPSLGGATLQMLPKVLASVTRFMGKTNAELF